MSLLQVGLLSGIYSTQYAASVMVNMKYNGWTDSYYTTPNGKLRPGDGNSTNIGLRGWWRPLSLELHS